MGDVARFVFISFFYLPKDASHPCCISIWWNETIKVLYEISSDFEYNMYDLSLCMSMDVSNVNSVCWAFVDTVKFCYYSIVFLLFISRDVKGFYKVIEGDFNTATPKIAIMLKMLLVIYSNDKTIVLGFFVGGQLNIPLILKSVPHIPWTY